MAKNKNNISESEALAKLAALGMDNKKALDVVLLDLTSCAFNKRNFF